MSITTQFGTIEPRQQETTATPKMTHESYLMASLNLIAMAAPSKSDVQQVASYIDQNPDKTSAGAAFRLGKYDKVAVDNAPVSSKGAAAKFGSTNK